MRARTVPHPQLPLGLRPADEPGFESYHCPDAEGPHIVRRHATGASSTGLVFVCGPPGVGKTHLLRASAREAARRGLRVAAAPLRDAPELPPAVREELEGADLVCLDDVDAVLGEPAWERALFSLHNVLEDRSARLLVSARVPPGGLPARLPDLRSRLAGGITVRLRPLGESERREALRLRARGRGFELTEEVLEYLLRRARRDMHSLVGYLDRLDASSLAERRPVTVSLAREMLASLEPCAPPPGSGPHGSEGA